MNLTSVDQTQRHGSSHDPLVWASLLCGIEEFRAQDPESAARALATWWSEVDSGSLSGILHSPPAPFLTLAFSNGAAFLESQLPFVQGILQQLQQGDIPFHQAMVQLAGQFGDETRLRAWRVLLHEFVHLADWLPGFEHAWDYLRNAFCSTDELEELRKALLSAVDDAQRFLVAGERSAFDRRFLEFRQGYLEYYCSLHQERRRGVSGRADSRMDFAGLRNLELLSQLPYTDKTYINRVRMLGHWAQPNECRLPVRQILEQQPRCYCNFNPAATDRTADATRQINREIRDGVEYFRALLRGSRQAIIEELKNCRVQESASRQIAVLLSSGGAVQLKPQAIEALRRIFRRRPEALLQQIQNCSPH